MEDAGGKVETRKVGMPSAEEVAKAWGMHQQSLREVHAKRTADGSSVSSDSAPSSAPITRDTLIMDVVTYYPEVLPILLDVGLHCIGCQLSSFDTMQTGCELHGFDQATIDALVKAMNEVVAGKKKEDAAQKKMQGKPRKNRV